MSLIGKMPIEVPAGVSVSVKDGQVTVKGKASTLSLAHRPEVTVSVEGDQVVVTRENDSRVAKAMHGMTRSLIANMVTGVHTGFTKELEIVGVGWNAKVQGKKLALNVGYADTKEVEIPAGVTVAVEGMKIKVSGPDKQSVGQFAAQVRSKRKPEPYNGKGIKYSDETIIRKAGKAFGSA